jgi:hypothetical protein
MVDPWSCLLKHSTSNSALDPVLWVLPDGTFKGVGAAVTGAGVGAMIL